MADSDRNSVASKMDEKNAVAEHVETSSPLDIDYLDSIENTESSRYAWLVSITAGVGGFLFGYDTGIISAILVYLGTDLGQSLDGSQKELITSITSGGAFLGAVCAGLFADKYGRKLPIYIGCALFIIGAIIQAASFSIAQMTIGRLVVGFGVGSAAMIVPVGIIPR